MKFLIGLIIIGGILLEASLHRLDNKIKALKEQQKDLDITIECVIAMQWKQDENLIKAYNGTEPSWQGHLYNEVEECEGVLYEED